MFPPEDKFDDDNMDTATVIETLSSPVGDGSPINHNDGNSKRKAKLTQQDLEENPVIQRMLHAMVERKLKEALESQNKGDQKNQNKVLQETPKSKDGKKRGQVLKSPSDTTIYAAVLKLVPNCRGVNVSVDKDFINSQNALNPNSKQGVIDVNNITTFIQGIRMESEQNREQKSMPDQTGLEKVGSSCASKTWEELDLDEAHKTAEKLEIEAKQF